MYGRVRCAQRGRLVLSQRTAWGKMRNKMGTGVSWGSAARSSEVVVQHVNQDSMMPFVGEAAIVTKRGVRASRTSGLANNSDDVSTSTVRASGERTCLVTLPREHALKFSFDFATFGELLEQRRQCACQRTSIRRRGGGLVRVRAVWRAYRDARCVCALGRLLLHNSMHQVAMLQAVEKHQDDTQRPSRELQDALQLAQTNEPLAGGVRLKPPKKPPPPHPHSPPRPQRGVVEAKARRTMMSGVEVHTVAMRMGLARKPPKYGSLDDDVANAQAANAPKLPARRKSVGKRGKRPSLHPKSSAGKRAAALMAGEEVDVAAEQRDDHAGGRFLETLAQHVGRASNLPRPTPTTCARTLTVRRCTHRGARAGCRRRSASSCQPTTADGLRVTTLIFYQLLLDLVAILVPGKTTLSTYYSGVWRRPPCRDTKSQNAPAGGRPPHV
jgi:hypothetical protein